MNQEGGQDMSKNLGYREVSLPPWFKDLKLCNMEDWKAFKKARKTEDKEDWVSLLLLLEFCIVSYFFSIDVTILIRRGF